MSRKKKTKTYAIRCEQGWVTSGGKLVVFRDKKTARSILSSIRKRLGGKKCRVVEVKKKR